MSECKVQLAHSFLLNQNKSQNTPIMKMLLQRLKVFYIRSDKDLFDNISFSAIKCDKIDLFVLLIYYDQGNSANH